MDRIADLIKDYDGQNPFSDSQARNFSDSKISNEFCPTSMFWTLFNDQHEVLLGTRGSGKTFLLKMMRYSMLKHIAEPHAKELIAKKQFLSLYVPMHLEFVTNFTNPDIPSAKQISLFQFAFNCLLAESLISELNAITKEESDKLKRAQLDLALSRKINRMWFNTREEDVSDFFELDNKLRDLFNNFDIKKGSIDDIPPVFKRQICSTLLSVKTIISETLGFEEEPTWIVCIDEAEFLNEPLQKCINSVFRSDSNRIALKVATLPYYHRTLETLDPNISVSAGNDFNYRVVDMKYNSSDFVNLTNKLCVHRLKSRFDAQIPIETLEDFLGIIGNDDQIDYYLEELGEEKPSREQIEEEIISNFSNTRKRGAVKYSNKRKTIYDKFAPIFFVRKMYELSRQGNRKPGWYAGSTTVRKIAQGNPRIFIQIMNELFEKARKIQLTPKIQHEVIFKFTQSFCDATQALETHGPTIFKELDEIAMFLHKQIHNGPLISVGCSFELTFKNSDDFFHSKEWIQLAIAYSRIFVADEVLKSAITMNTKYLLANIYAAKYWIPMRGDITTKIPAVHNKENTYVVNRTSPVTHQMSLFEEETI